MHMRLLQSRISHQSEEQGRKSEAQIRQILQAGLGVVQQTWFQLATSYRSRLSIYNSERIKLLEDNRIAEELVVSQKQLIEMYEARDRQHQHHVEGGPLLSQFNDHNNQHQSSQYLTYQPPRSQELTMDPSRLGPLDDLDYSIGAPLVPCNIDAVPSAPVAEFQNQSPILPSQSTPLPTPNEHDVSEPDHTNSDGNKVGQEGEGVRPSKKRKTR